MESAADPRYFFVRAMGQTDQEFAVFFEQNVVAVGWSRIDFTTHEDTGTLVAAVEREYYPEGRSVAPQVVGKKKNEARRFKSIRVDDRILVPYGSSVRLAVAKAEELYDREAGHTLDLANQRRVSYVAEPNGAKVTIPRAALSEGLQRRLRVRGTTVSDLVEFSDEIEDLYRSGGREWSARVQERMEELATSFKTTLLENIRVGRSNLKAGGRGLEELVRHLLEVEGYEAEILSKRAFAGMGDADIAASRADRFGESKLLVQVKHHQGASDAYGAEQLLQILRDQPEEYADYRLVLVTSAEASEDVAALCEERDIALVSGPELVDWIFYSLEHLGPEWRTTLGVSDVPQIAV